MKNLIILLLSVIIFNSCKEVIDMDIPEGEKKIVVNGIFKADSIITLHISKSMNIQDDINWNKLPVIEDANIEIYENGILLNPLNYNDYGYYNSSYVVKNNREYEIKISTSELNPVNTKINVPGKIEILSIDTASFYGGSIFITDSGSYIPLMYEVKVELEDPANEKNYYLISCKKRYDHIYLDTSLHSIQMYIDNPQLVLLNLDTIESVENHLIFSQDRKTGANAFSDEGVLVNDDIINGQKVSISIILQPERMVISKLEYYFYLISITEDYYKYILSKSMSGIESPFAHPVQVFSNIENGYGIIAGCSESVDTISFSQEIIVIIKYNNLEEMLEDYLSSFINEDFD